MRAASWASLAAVSTLLAGSAEAMPSPAPYRADSGITLAAGGCGPAFHRNIYGNCVPNGYGWGGPVVVGPGFYGAPGYGYGGWHGGYGGWHGGYYGGGWHGGGWHGGGWHGGGWHGGGWHGGGWHGGGWHGGGWHGGGGAHWHGGGAHFHGGGHHR
jgi:hypothetical protein